MESGPLKPGVESAIEELRKEFSKSKFTVKPDDQGGALVIIETVPLGTSESPYVQRSTWVGFRLQFQYPISDVYPIFVRGDLARKDGRKALGEAITVTTFDDRPALQLSRRSNHRDPQVDTAVLKVMKVLKWLLEK